LNGEPKDEFEGGSADAPAPEQPSADLPIDLPEISEESAGGEPEFRRRAFTAWGAAHAEESGPSLLHRASQKLKALFGRKERPAEIENSDEPLLELADAEPEAQAPVAEADALPALDVPGEIDLLPALSEANVMDAPDEPKENLKFLWSPAETETEAEVETEATAESVPQPTLDDAPPEFDAVEPVVDETAPVLETRSLLDDEPPAPKKPGFFRRLFSSRSKPAIPDEPENAPEEEYADASSSDATMPMDVSDVGATQPMDVSDVGATQPMDVSDVGSTQPMDVSDIGATQPMDVSGVGATQPMDVSSLDDALPMDEAPAESEADDVDATMPISLDDIPAPVAKKPGFFARLLGRKPVEEPEAEPEFVDEVAEEPVAAADSEQLDAAHDVFAAAKDEFVPEQTQGESFASVDDALPVEESQYAPPAPPPELDQSFQAMPVYDFDTPKPDERSTLEVDMPEATDDSRPTAEVSAEVAAHADEEDRDTDEFDQVDLDLDATVAEDPDKTGEVKREPGFFKKLFSKTKEVTQVEPAVAPPPTANPTFLVQKFRTFYNEVVVYKNQKAEFTAGFATAILTDYTADLSPEQAAQSLIVRLQQMLELQLAESSWMGGESQELYPEAQYAMAVLADEMLTNMEWPGQAAWGQHRLELAVFKTAAADVEFFKRVDRLLKNGPQTTGTRDLARVYLLVIASGFRGKYRPFDLHRPLAEYRRRLYEFVYGGDALLLYADDRRIFPEATSVTVAGKGVRRFSMAQQWAAILVLLLAGYTVISHITWNRVSADLKDIAARVEQARTATTAVDSPNGGGGR
jgi:type IV/VI secretion system ImpK/VasF family protein